MERLHSACARFRMTRDATVAKVEWVENDDWEVIRYG